MISYQDRGGDLKIYFRLALFAAICAGFFVLFGSRVDPIDNEFFNLYAGATIGPRRLYHPEIFAQFAASLHAKVLEARFYYTRMPCFAILTKPLSWFSFSAAFWIWRGVQAAAIAASVWLWPGRKSTLTAVALVSLPVVWVVTIAQDVGLVLLFVAAAVALERRGRPRAAGVVFSLCLSKPHLVIFVPLVMLIRRDFRFLAGAALGASAELLLSFAVAPADWPSQWLSVLANPQMHPFTYAMPGMRELAQTHAGAIVAALIAASLAASIWRSCRDGSVVQPVALALAAGVIANLHSYSVDCVLLIPVVAMALGSEGLLVRALGFFLATPIPFMVMLSGYAAPLQAAVFALIHLQAWWPPAPMENKP